MDDILKYAIENGIIDLSYVQEKIEMNKREELLKKHPYKIWESKNGDWYTYLPDKEKGRIQKKRKSKREIENIIVEYWKTELENPTINEVFEEWNNRRLELKKIAQSTHLRNKQIYSRHYNVFGNKRIKSVSTDEFSDFLEEQIPKYNLTQKAFSNLKTVSKGFLRRAKKRNLIDFNVESLFQELDISESDFKNIIKEDYEEVFNEDEMPVIMNYLENNRDIRNLGILLMFVTGARIGEVVALKRSDFFENIIKIRRTETRYLGENGKYICDIKEFPKTKAGVRTVIIPEDYLWLTSELLKCQSESNEFVFVGENGRLTTQSIRMRLGRICRKLGIYNKSPHKIRKTYGTILLDNHIDNVLIIGQMGHTNILTTERHYHRNRKTVETKSRVIDAIPEFSHDLIAEESK